LALLACEIGLVVKLLVTCNTGAVLTASLRLDKHDRERHGSSTAQPQRRAADSLPSGDSEPNQSEQLSFQTYPALSCSADGRLSDFNAAARVLFGDAALLTPPPIEHALPFIPNPRREQLRI
jgi:hypothetical protein